jgi:hypothetical protein
MIDETVKGMAEITLEGFACVGPSKTCDEPVDNRDFPFQLRGTTTGLGSVQ